MDTTATRLTLRSGTPADAAACGRICYEAFGAIAARHNFPTDVPSVEIATGLLAMLLAHPQVYGVVAEVDGAIVGSNFLDERSPVAGVGPITIDPQVQDHGVGRRLMQAVLAPASERRCAGVRLLQDGYHTRSLALYATLGFAVRAPIACRTGHPVRAEIPGYTVRPAIEADVEACNQVCRLVHGHDRGGEVREAITQGTALVVEHAGRITGYCTALAYFGHAVGESVEDLKALIASGRSFAGPGILVPAQDSALFPWCLQQGLRVVKVMTLMSLGLYHQPMGAYMPSVFY
jgi:predicted N-acetyltransferase YhbS